jgi:urease accessory protein
MGASLLRVFPALALNEPRLPGATYPAAYAIACAQLGIARETALAAYLWSWSENQVLVAVKTVPLGQQAGQAMLYQLHARVQRALEKAAALGDDELGSAPLGLALRSAQHETQYSRLYRS